MMRRGLAVLALVGLLFVSSHASGGSGPADQFTLLGGFAAKETCSCVFVVGQTDAYCNSFGQQPPYYVTIMIDHTAKTVTVPTASATRVARYGANGCILDPVP